MKEQAESVLAEARRVGRLGIAACAYACPGCPATRDEGSLRVRAIGWTPTLADRLSAGPPRYWELASGVLPRAITAWAELAALGVRRVITPFFSRSVPGTSEDPGELMDAHDAESGIAGSARAALDALGAARDAGIEAVIVGVNDRAGDPASSGALRILMRLAWARRVSLEVSSGGEPPCIAQVRDYNQLHL